MSGLTARMGAALVVLFACEPERELPGEGVRCGDTHWPEPAGVVHGGLLAHRDGAALSIELDLGRTSPGPSGCVNVLVEVFAVEDEELNAPLARVESWVSANLTESQWTTAPVHLSFPDPPKQLAGQEVVLSIHTRSERGGREIWLNRALKQAKPTDTLPEAGSDCSHTLEAWELELLSGGRAVQTGDPLTTIQGLQGLDMLVPSLDIRPPPGVAVESDESRCASVRLQGVAPAVGETPGHRQMLSGGMYELSRRGDTWRSGGLFYPIFFGDTNSRRLTLDALVLGEGWRASRRVEVAVEL